MGFFNVMKHQKRKGATTYTKELIHKLECKACPLNNCEGILRNPKMAATGDKKPVVYMLGEAPGADEDELGEQFVGKSGEFLRWRLPHDWEPYLRWNNTLRCRPPKNRDPTETETEACRPSIVRDIEASKPRAIFGFGNFPLTWATRETGITKWRGKKIPVQIGSHTCWYFPFMHPAAILRSRKWEPRSKNEYGSDDEFAFAMDLKRAFAQVESLPVPVIHTPEMAKEGVEIVMGDDPDLLDKVVDFLNDIWDDDYVGFDYETHRGRPYYPDSRILTVAFSGERRTMAFPLEHPRAHVPRETLQDLKDLLWKFFMRASCKKCVHALNFEQEWTGFFFGKSTIRAGEWGCSLSQAYVLDGRQGGKDLESLCVQYFGLPMKEISNLDRKKLAESMPENVLFYNGIDAKYHRLVYIRQSQELATEGLMNVYLEHMRRVPTMVLTQLKGMPVDVDLAREFEEQHEHELADIEAEIAELPEVKKFEDRERKRFQPSSNKHVMTILHRAGHILDSVDEKELEKIDGDFPKFILQYRGIAKLLSTYVKPMLPGSDVLFPGDLLHPIYTTTTVVTWRTSSNGPNAQNYPKHENKHVRKPVRARKKRVYAFDYAGIQARNVAMESLDKTLIDAFWHDYDIHSDWANETVRLYPRWIEEGLQAYKDDKKVQKKYRQIAKNKMVFPSFFGAFPKKIAEGMGIPIDVAEKLHGKFWKRFPQIKDWHERIETDFKRTGYVTGLTGFRRRAPIASTELINSPIQSDEAMIVCGAMNRLSEMCEGALQANIEIHDDLTFIWTDAEADEYVDVVGKEMTRLAYPWMSVVPIVVELSIGDNWADVEEQPDKFSSIKLWGHKR